MSHFARSQLFENSWPTVMKDCGVHLLYTHKIPKLNNIQVAGCTLAVHGWVKTIERAELPYISHNQHTIPGRLDEEIYLGSQQWAYFFCAITLIHRHRHTQCPALNFGGILHMCIGVHVDNPQFQNDCSSVFRAGDLYLLAGSFKSLANNWHHGEPYEKELPVGTVKGVQ
jgi:hypothetical protein